MPRLLLTIVLVVLLALAIQSTFEAPPPAGPDGQPSPEPVKIIFREPSAELREKLQPVIQLMTGDPTAADLAFFYRNVSRLIEPDDETGLTGTVTAEQARRLHREAGLALHRADPVTSYHEDLKPLLETLFVETVGRENKRLGDDDRKKIVNLFEGIAWALWSAASEEQKVDYQEPERLWDEPGEIYWTRGPPPQFTHGLLTPEADESTNLPDHRQAGANYGLLQPTAEELAEAQKLPLMGSLNLAGTGAGKTRLLYRSLLKFDSGAYSENQRTGDCTSHGTRNACDTARAFELDVKGKLGAFFARGATECIYGYRGHGGQGMLTTRAVKFVNEYGGIAVRKEYGPFDLRQYNVGVGIRWGRQGGPPQEVLEEIRSHPAQNVVRINSVAEACDAIYNGMAMTVGCGYSFSGQRDKYGFARRTRGGWAHCMAWIATAPERVLIDGSESDDPCFLIANSWGAWNSGPKGRFKDIPDGSFWVTTENAAGMLASARGYGGAFAIGDIENYPPKPLEDWGFDYLALKPANDYQHRSEIPVHWRGAAAFAYVASLSVVPRADVTKPRDEELDGVVPSPDPVPDGVDDHCDTCKGNGWINGVDNNPRDCPNPRCPYRKSVQRREVIIRRPDGSAVIEQHLFHLGA